MNKSEKKTEKWVVLYNSTYNEKIKVYPSLFDTYEDARKLPLAAGLNRVSITKITL